MNDMPTERVRDLIGSWRRFGEDGPVYEVIGIGENLPGGAPTMRVRVMATEEEADYRLADLLADPSAA